MCDLIWLTDAQMRRIEPYFPLSHGVPRVDDRRIISGIIFVIRNGLRWRDAPAAYGPAKTIYNRFISRRGDGHLRGLLYEAAVVILTRSTAESATAPCSLPVSAPRWTWRWWASR